MKVADVMTSDVQIALPDMEICDAARLMAELDVGVLPVSDGGKLIGIITDRDIAIRAVALKQGPETPVDAVMSRAPRFCYEDDELNDVRVGLSALQVRRMPVLDRDHRLVGIVSLSDAALHGPPAATGEALADITAPGGEHSQADDEDPHAVAAPVITAGASNEAVDPALDAIHFSDDEPS